MSPQWIVTIIELQLIAGVLDARGGCLEKQEAACILLRRAGASEVF